MTSVRVGGEDECEGASFTVGLESICVTPDDSALFDGKEEEEEGGGGRRREKSGNLL